MSCGSYNFTGAGSINAKTFQVNFFQNNAPLIEPGLDRDFTFALQDFINNQTNLALVSSNGELVFEGEIVEYRVSPMTATANQLAAQSRLNITVNVRFINNNKEGENTEKRFSHFYDFPADKQLIGATLTTAKKEIFDRITQDIFSETLSKW
ncbi:MAG: LptE family protein [Flavobacterium sp.]